MRQAGRSRKPAVLPIRSWVEGLPRGIEKSSVCAVVMLIAGCLGSSTEKATFKAELARQVVKGLPSKFRVANNFLLGN